MAALSPELRDVAYDMAARSNHPVSRCLAEALARTGRASSPTPSHRGARPRPSLRRNGDVLSPRRARVGGARHAAELRRHPARGRRRARCTPSSRARRCAPAPGASSRRLTADGLRRVAALGRCPRARVAAVAAALGIAPERGARRAFTRGQGSAGRPLDREDTLFIGDGVNDRLAFAAALVRRHPGDRSPGDAGQVRLLPPRRRPRRHRRGAAAARRLRAVVRRNLVISFTYNVLAVTACSAAR